MHILLFIHFAWTPYYYTDLVCCLLLSSQTVSFLSLDEMCTLTIKSTNPYERNVIDTGDNAYTNMHLASITMIISIDH